MISNCMYGAPHPGDAVLVRNKVGKSVGALCPTHYKKHQKALAEKGYHFRTYAEMAAREGKELIDDGRETTEQDMDSQSDSTWGDIHIDDSGPSQESPGAAYVESPHYRSVRGQDSLDPVAPDPGERAIATRPSSPSTTADLAQRLPEARAATRGATAEGSGGLVIQPVPALAWWQGAGELSLSDYQREILWQPFDPAKYECRFDGLYYLPWVYVWQRLLEAFKPDVPQMVPLSEPKIVDDTVTIHYTMLVHGQYVGEAWGEMSKKGDNKKVTYAMCAEGCCSDAITRIAKRLGVNLELWEPSTIRELKRRQK